MPIEAKSSILQPQKTSEVCSVSSIIDVAGGIMLCYGISLAIGYSILLKFDKAAICCLLAIIGGFIVAKWYKKEVKALAQTGTFISNQKEK